MSAKAQMLSGMQTVAERSGEDFQDAAYHFIRCFARVNKEFKAEQCTICARDVGLIPHDDRAWGAPFQRAAREGLIKRIGYRPSLRRHLSPTILWGSLIWAGKRV